MNLAVAATLVLVDTMLAHRMVGFKVRKRRIARHSADQELVLLADALVVEYAAKALLADAVEALALHYAVAPFDMKQIGYGMGLLAGRIAAGEAISAQRQLQFGKDFPGANVRLGLSRNRHSP